MKLPNRLLKKLELRKEHNALRDMTLQNNLVDFSSNDYLGLAKSNKLYEKSHEFLQQYASKNGSTGSRLLSGNHQLHENVEQQLAAFFNSETALLFNSGYDANIGLFSSILQRGDVIFYDEFVHASIRDGVQMSNANAFKFKHNNVADLEQKILRQTQQYNTSHLKPVEVYVVTESVFSMDGDSPDLETLSNICEKYNAHFIVDEAHATAVLGHKGSGLIKELNLESKIFARVHTFGKALGCHGAVVLGSAALRSYLINFARSFIYTTAIPLHTVATIKTAFEQLVKTNSNEESHFIKLQTNIKYFNQQLARNNQQLNFIESNSAIHCCIIPGNEKVKSISLQLHENGLDVKPILSPTVPIGQERLRICLHSYNSINEIDEVLKLLGTFANESSLRTK